MKLTHLLIAGTALVSSAALAAGDQQKDRSAQAGSPSATAGASAGTMGGAQARQEHSEQVVRQVQEQLKQKGHEVGPVDGIMGPQTKDALKEFQQKEGIQASGELDQQTLQALGVDAAAAVGGTAPGAAPTVGAPSDTGTATPGASPAPGAGAQEPMKRQ
jgi:peptidoglycan hydrolase-like protein with peptidoglycan-binding domain